MRRALRLAVLPLILAACTEPPPPVEETPAPQPEATSLLGEQLFAKEDTAGEIAAADSALATAPDDVEFLIAAGRARRNSWHYREEMALYTKVIGMVPDDWRPYRFRGHRYISVREFDNAIRDLDLTWTAELHAPVLLVSPDGKASRFPRAMCAFETPDGRKGRGWIEFNFPEGVPHLKS